MTLGLLAAARIGMARHFALGQMLDCEADCLLLLSLWWHTPKLLLLLSSFSMKFIRALEGICTA